MNFPEISATEETNRDQKKATSQVDALRMKCSPAASWLVSSNETILGVIAIAAPNIDV